MANLKGSRGRAEYGATCAKCGAHIESGDYVTWAVTGDTAGDYRCAPSCDNPYDSFGNLRETETATETTSGARATTPPSRLGDFRLETDDAADVSDFVKETNAEIDAEVEEETTKPPTRSTGKNDPLGAALAAAVQPYIESAKIDKKQLEDLERRLDAKVDALTPPPVKVSVTTDGTTVEVEGICHFMLPKLIEAMASGQNVYIWGPPGTGKSHAFEQAALALGREFSYDSLDPMTPPSRLGGYMHAGGGYVTTKYRLAFEDGGAWCGDELDNTAAILQTTLNSSLSNGHGSFPDGMVTRSPQNIVGGTGNTNGEGSNEAFPERRAMDKAFQDRFVYLYWPNDLAVERAVAKQKNPDATAWVAWVIQVREFCETRYKTKHVTPRTSYQGAEMLRDCPSWTVEEIADATLFKGCDPDMRAAILAACPLPADSR